MSVLDAAFPVAEQFARTKGLRAARRSSFSGPYIGIAWREKWVTKTILVTPGGPQAGLAADAQATHFAPWRRLAFLRPPASTGRGPWRIEGLDEERAEELTQALEEAWQWLKSMDLAAVLAEDKARLEHMTLAILPALARLADDWGGRLAQVRLSSYEIQMEWSLPSPMFRLDVYCNQRNGFAVAGLRQEPGEPSEHGWVIYERMLSDLRVQDWRDLGRLSAMLEEAKRRIEEGGEPGSSMIRLPPLRG